MTDHTKKHYYAILGLALVTAVTFFSVLLPPKAVVANDSPLSSIIIRQKMLNENQLVTWNANGYLGIGGGALTRSINSPLIRWLPAQYYNTVLFTLCTFLVGAGMYLFCITLGIKPLASFCGSCSLMLSGPFITAVYSGHSGTFIMWAFLCLALWLVTWGVYTRNVLALGWSGICGGIGVRSQLDIGFIIVLFFFAWLVYIIWQTRAKKVWLKLSAGLAIAVVAGFLFSASSIYSLMGLASESTGEGTAVTTERTPEEQWNWATQWSLPKIETLTFIVPGFFGWGHTVPYWGSIGRDARWPESGFPRFSISTQNIGVVVIALSILGLCAYAFNSNQHRGVIVFWSIAALIALLFAWGRYLDIAPTSATGFGPYRVFYLLPKMDAMRNPIKFLYPFMLGLAVCAAYGFNYLQDMLESPASKKEKKHRR